MSKGFPLPPLFPQFLSWFQSRLPSVPKPRLPSLTKFQLPPLNPLATQTASARMRSIIVSALVPGIKANWEWPAYGLFMTIQAFTTNYFGKSWFGTLGRALFPFAGMGITAAATWRKSVQPELMKLKYMEPYSREQNIKSQGLEKPGAATLAMTAAWESVQAHFTRGSCCIDPSSHLRGGSSIQEALPGLNLHEGDFIFPHLRVDLDRSIKGRVNEQSLQARYAECLQRYAAKCNEFNQTLLQGPQGDPNSKLTTLEATVAQLARRIEAVERPVNTQRKQTGSAFDPTSREAALIEPLDPYKEQKENLVKKLLAIKTELAYLRHILKDPTSCCTYNQVTSFLNQRGNINTLKQNSVADIADLLGRQTAESFTSLQER
jgi:hypothetical protein